MSNVTLAIGGRNFTVACANGEEAHITALGQMIDAKVLASGAIAQNETRMLLFAALMLADEVHEIGDKLAQATANNAPDLEAAEQLQARFDLVAMSLEGLAEELETRHLEDPARIA